MTDAEIKAMQAFLAQAEAERGQQTESQPAQPPQKFAFAGQEWTSQQEAEAAALRKFQEQEQRIRELEAAQQTARPQPQQAAVPGTPKQLDQQKYFKLLTEDPIAANKMLLRATLFGDPDAELDPVPVLQQSVVAGFQAQAKIAELELRSNHPEVPWHDPKVMQLIDQTCGQINMPTNAIGRERAVERLQAYGMLPSRANFEQMRQQQMQQAAPQQQPNNVRPMPQRDVWETQTRATPPPQIPAGGQTAGLDPTNSDFDTWFMSLKPEQRVAVRDQMRKQAAGA